MTRLQRDLWRAHQDARAEYEAQEAQKFWGRVRMQALNEIVEAQEQERKAA